MIAKKNIINKKNKNSFLLTRKIRLKRLYYFALVVPPVCRVISTGLFVFHEPLVKSGTSIEVARFATDFSLKGAIALQRAQS